MSTKVYDSKAVDVILCDIPITDGLGDPFLTITPTSNAFDTEVGVDGEVIRFATHDDRFDIELTLKGSSVHNSQLAALHAADRSSTSGAGIGVMLVKDGNGSTLYASDRIWVTQAPPKGFGQKPEDCTWKFQAVIPALTALPGGN